MLEHGAQTRGNRWRIFGILAAGLLIIVAAGLGLISQWAFSRQRVAKALEEATSAAVQFHSFRNVYFPRPGCIAEGVTFRRNSDASSPPFIVAAKLVVVSSFTGILKTHVSLVEADGVLLTTGGGWPVSSSASKTVVERLLVKDATLQVPRGKTPMRFAVHELSFENLGGAGPMPFQVAVSNAIPPGEVVARGKLGPWDSHDRVNTPIAGSYSFRHADLSFIDGIAGLLSSDGEFHGPINQLEVDGSTDTPDFEVVHTAHKFPLSTRFHAVVNGANGDITLKDVEARLERSDIGLQGTVMPAPPDKRRTASLDAISHEGRIQDILFPFVRQARSPLNGVTSFRAHITLPAGQAPFVRRVALQADFGIGNARFTSPVTQAKVNKMSEGARGHPDDDDPEDVVSDLRGRVNLKDGVATFSNLSFSVPGAKADMHGSFNIVNERIDLHGTVRLEAKVSDTTTGVKSFLIKALNPFIKKDKPREPLPVAISGTYGHPQYSVSIASKKKQARGGE